MSDLKVDTVPHIVTLRFAWSQPSIRVKATFRAEALSHIVKSDHYLCKLIDLQRVERKGADDTSADSKIRDLVGKYVRVPQEALDGLVLPLKITTLTGKRLNPYFFDEP